jgi:hypothetical protein
MQSLALAVAKQCLRRRRLHVLVFYVRLLICITQSDMQAFNFSQFANVFHRSLQITTPNIVSSVSLILQGNSAVSQQKNPRSQEQRFIVDLIISFH